MTTVYQTPSGLLVAMNPEPVDVIPETKTIPPPDPIDTRPDIQFQSKDKLKRAAKALQELVYLTYSLCEPREIRDARSEAINDLAKRLTPGVAYAELT